MQKYMVTIVEPHPNEQSKLVDRYLVRYGGSNTSTQNLWDALDGEDFSNGEVGRRVTEVMDTWTKQQGFPWVRVGSFFIYIHRCGSLFVLTRILDLHWAS